MVEWISPPGRSTVCRSCIPGNSLSSCIVNEWMNEWWNESVHQEGQLAVDHVHQVVVYLPV